MSIFSERLIQLRKDKGLSQIALSKEIEVSPRVYQSYEYGKSEPGMSRLVRIADFFGVSLDYLTGRTDMP